jgi:FixJ family two-component response regulator
MDFRHNIWARGRGEPVAIPTVFIVDTDRALRDSLAPPLDATRWRVRWLSSAEEFLALPRTRTPGCLLLEVDLPGMTGLELQQAVGGRVELPVVFLSRAPGVADSVRAMKAGAFDFLAKPASPELLVRTLAGALERSRAALRHLEQIQALQVRYESLSRREREVMNLVVSGRLNKQVGGDLGISEITVKAHRGKLMRKMQAGSFAELVNMSVNLRAGMLNLAAQE